MGDKLSNMRAIWRDYQVQGDALWNLFHVTDRASHEWHYRGLAASLSPLADTFAYCEFVRLIDEVFKKSEC
jgi:myo-inositol-1(or 4)-monophosphatase